MPNHHRIMASGRELYVIWIPLWFDDVSGNVSKQYNKHLNCYTTIANLPGQLLQQEFFVLPVTTSPNASTSEQASAILKFITCVQLNFMVIYVCFDQYLSDTHTEPYVAYNGHLKRECCFILRVPSGPSDNPQADELCSHAGKICYCRKCKSGTDPSTGKGSTAYRESQEGFHSLHLVSSYCCQRALPTISSAQ